MRLNILALLLIAPTAALADDKTAVTRTLDALAECRLIEADSARLACFDKSIATLETARSKGDLIVLDRAKVVERRRAQFGLGTVGDAGVGGEQVSEVQTTITDFGKGSQYGRWHVQLANGQVWETIDPLRYTFKKGESVTIRATALGGFRGQFARQSSPVKRIR